MDLFLASSFNIMTALNQVLQNLIFMSLHHLRDAVVPQSEEAACVSYRGVAKGTRHS